MRRHVLGGLLALIAINAFGGGFYGITGARDIPREWLAGSPFESYFIPSLFLVVVIGGGCFVASIAVFARAWFARSLAFVMGLIVLAWIAAQIGIIGYVSWMQPATTLAGALVVVLSWHVAAIGDSTASAGSAPRS